MKCLKCGVALVSIGKQRANGKDFTSNKNDNNDWATRKYHKKCWKEKVERDKLLTLIMAGASGEELMYNYLL